MEQPGDAILDRVTVDETTKGFPPIRARVPLREIGARGWTLADLQPPIVALRRSALEHNLALMAAYCDRHGVELAPHGKTTMAPQLWDLQLEAGAWGLTAATAVQARAMRAFGVGRILIANEVTDPGSIRWVADDLAGGGELLCYVDSLRGVELLERHLRDAGPARPLKVLVELGHRGGRTGCREPEEAVEVGRAVGRSTRLALAGVAGFEGTVAHDRAAGSLDGVRAFLDALRGLTERLLDDGALGPDPVVSAGGSLYFDLVVERLAGGWRDDAARVILRSGCYLTHDAGFYDRSSPFAAEPADRRFRSALEAYGAVLSRPEPGVALLGLGRRDVPFDQGYPRPLLVRGPGGSAEPIDGRVEITALNDQHAFCRVGPEVRLEVGDLVLCGISHPCTAFDRWRIIPVLDDDDHVVDAVATFF